MKLHIITAETQEERLLDQKTGCGMLATKEDLLPESVRDKGPVWGPAFCIVCVRRYVRDHQR